MEVVNNKRAYRFETTLPDGEMAYMEYRWLKGSMALMHTFVPTSGRGTGTGAALVQHVLDHARSHGLKVIAYCPFVVKYLKEHPEYQDLLDENHPI
jgi:uncharacterized protein